MADTYHNRRVAEMKIEMVPAMPDGLQRCEVSQPPFGIGFCFEDQKQFDARLRDAIYTIEYAAALSPRDQPSG